ncbi:MAG TPA: pitrilysin family protein [Candidatus Angelobacter sp.]|nr:pitrilysin family protein [Candidatus Angelobacter sp.]
MSKMNWLKQIVFTGMALVGSLVAQTAPKQAPPAGGPPKAFQLPAKQTFSLPNGLRVTMVPYGKLPKVTVAVIVRAGALNEGPDQVWMSDFIGRMIKEGGTTSRNAQQVAQEAASMGGSVDVNAGADQTEIALDVLSEFGSKAVALLADVSEHPLLPDSDLPRMKQDAQRRLAISRSQSQPLAREQFMKALYPDHPYGRIFPTEEMISKYTIADIQKFYKENFGAARTHVYVAGKFDSPTMKKAITDAFSGWAKGPDPLINIPKPETKRAFTLIDRPNATQSTVYVGLPTVYPGEADYIPLSVTNSLLGGSFASRITSNIREQKGYTYSPFSQLSSRYHDAYWAEVADVTTAVTGPSLKEIFYEINRLQKEAPPEAELKGIQDYIAGLFILQNSSRQGIISQLAFADLHNLGDDYLETYVKKVYAVTPEQVQQMAEKHLTTDKMTIVVVGDKSKIADQLTPYENSGQ